MRCRGALAIAGISVALFPLMGRADVTGITGGSQPQPTIQPSMGLNYIMRTEGVFQDLGEVTLFAGNFAPAGWTFANGQLLPISQNDALFSMLGTTYGGDGQTSFAVPNLQSRVPIGQGQGPGLTPRTIGETAGVEQVQLTVGNLPAHTHTLPGGGTTGSTGSGLPYTNMQPALAMNYLVALQGIYPSRDTGPGPSTEPLLGTVRLSAAPSIPNGWATASGQLLPIVQNQALFSLFGTTYGGDGRTTFALPDLRGRSVIGAGTGPGLTTQTLGQTGGVESVSLTEAQLPPHTHTLPGGGTTGIEGGGQVQTNMQPTLALHYIIAEQGIFPPRDGGGSDEEPLLGQIQLFAGNFAPGGWAFCEGQTLSISQNTALFSLLGTTYGGDGRTTFALPNLDGRLAVDAGQGPGLSPWDLGQTGGSELNTLSINQMPTHDHTFVPEPAAMGVLTLGGMALLRSRRKP